MAITMYQDLEVWKKSMETAVQVYEVTKMFPVEERYGLTAQMRKSAISIPSNIAEGYRRHSRKDYARFVSIAFGSGAELETQIELSKRLGYVEDKQIQKLSGLLNEVMRMLNGLHSGLVG